MSENLICLSIDKGRIRCSNKCTENKKLFPTAQLDETYTSYFFCFLFSSHSVLQTLNSFCISVGSFASELELCTGWKYCCCGALGSDMNCITTDGMHGTQVHAPLHRPPSSFVTGAHLTIGCLEWASTIHQYVLYSYRTVSMQPAILQTANSNTHSTVALAPAAKEMHKSETNTNMNNLFHMHTLPITGGIASSARFFDIMGCVPLRGGAFS